MRKDDFLISGGYIIDSAQASKVMLIKDLRSPHDSVPLWYNQLGSLQEVERPESAWESSD